jgi:hypothetical protein
MKKTLILIACLVACELAIGQIFRERDRYSFIGARAGYSLAGWKGLAYVFPDLTYANVSGFHAGIFVSLRIADNITLEPGAYYSTKGWAVEGSLDDGPNLYEGTLTNNYSCIDAPLMLRIYLKGLNFGLGPQFSLPIKSELKYEGTLNGQPVATQTYENTVDLNDFDVAAALAIGYEFNWGLSFTATYDIGLTLAHADDPYPYNPPWIWSEGKSRVVKLSVSFIIY